MRLILAGLAALAGARGHLLPWAPVFLAFGIGAYFALRTEPGPEALGLFALVVLALLVMARRGPELLQVPAIGLALVAAGLVLAAARAHLVAAPVLAFRYYGPIEGRIIAIDRSFSDELRLTLDRVVLEDVPPDRTPARVRVALHGAQGFTEPAPGLTVILTGHLSPPEGPVEPGGFDFQRLAWFSRLGGVGYTRSPLLALAPPEGGLVLFAFRLRMRISAAMQDVIPGQPGAFAAALMTGDRSGVDRATSEALRLSNLSHLISISGLHMGLLVAFVFAACRYGLALVPPVALRIDSRKLAALVALGAAAFYLALAGPNVATRRAFIMAAVMLVAVLADRRAVTLRSLAIAALIVLVLEPESLVEPGFQMSFGATVALIVAFEGWHHAGHRLPRPLQPAAMLLLSSMAAGIATTPIAAAHFNRIADYGLVANLVAVPIMGMLVMPAGVIAALLAPLGLAWLPLGLMGIGCKLILDVATGVAGLEGSVTLVPAPPWGVLALLATGGFVLLVARPLWLRGAGGAAAALAILLWAGGDRPLLLVAADGGLTGVLGPAGRALSKPKGAGFVAKSWLEDDGDGATQEAASARPGFRGARGDLTATVAGLTVRHLTGKGASDRMADACTDGALVVTTEVWEGPAPADCIVFDRRKLEITGALAIHAGPKIVTARETAGDRIWNRPPGTERRLARSQ